MTASPRLEVIAASVADARAAEAAGAHRLELVQALSEGGLTPSFGLVTAVRDAVRIPVMVMVRPRGGDFVYAEDEARVMRSDVAILRELGVAGVVVGALQEDGSVHGALLEDLVVRARPLEVTFHRAFDAVADQSTALEELVELGVDRVLTSGGATNAEAGAARLAALVEQARGRIVVMPGAGISATNVARIRTATQAHEFHGSFSRVRPHDGTRHVDADEVRAALVALGVSGLP